METVPFTQLLTDDQRVLVCLLYFDRLNFREAAEALGTSEQEVKRRYAEIERLTNPFYRRENND